MSLQSKCGNCSRYCTIQKCLPIFTFLIEIHFAMKRIQKIGKLEFLGIVIPEYVPNGVNKNLQKL